MKKIYFLLAILLVPLSAFAFGNIQQVIIATGDLIGKTIPVVFAMGLLFFLWGLSIFVSHAGDEKKLDEGKRIMKWGIIALFVMTSVWGIVLFFQGNFGVTGVNSLPSSGNTGVYVAPL